MSAEASQPKKKSKKETPFFRAVFPNGAALASLCKMLKTLTNDVNFEATSDELSFNERDASSVAMFVGKFSRDYFDEYACARNTTFGISTKWIMLYLNFAKGDTKIAFELYASAEDVLYVKISHQNGKLDTFEVKLLFLEREKFEPDFASAPATAVLPFSTFSEAMRNLGLIGDTVRYKVRAAREGHELVCYTEGESGVAKIALPCTSATATMANYEPLAFALRYVISFLGQLNDSVSLKFMSPGHVTYDVFLLGIEYALADNATVTYYLAPKSDEDEDADVRNRLNAG